MDDSLRRFIKLYRKIFIIPGLIFFNILYAGITALEKTTIDSIINSAIQDSVFPGAVLCFGNSQNVSFINSYGRYDYSPMSSPVTTDCIYDLASLTKVIATTSSIMRLIEKGLLNLNDPVSDHISDFGVKNKKQISIKNLLVHNSGLSPGRPLYSCCETKEVALDSLFNLKLQYRTGEETVYSDLGFIMLGLLVEKIAHQSLDVYVNQILNKEMQMKETIFNPDDSIWTRIIPTDPEINMRLIKNPGTVRNTITRIFNGVAGHAGLFSSARDLAIFATMYLNHGDINGKKIFSKSTIDNFSKKQLSHSTRALGWDTANGNQENKIANLFSDDAFGHTGFTGTSIWIDPTIDLYIILLTNRTYEMTNRSLIKEFRPLIHDYIIECIIKN